MSKLLPSWQHASPAPPSACEQVARWLWARGRSNIRYCCTSSISVRLFRERKKKRALALVVRTRKSYGCYTVVFVRPFRTRTESYTVLSLVLALLLHLLGSQFYD